MLIKNILSLQLNLLVQQKLIRELYNSIIIIEICKEVYKKVPTLGILNVLRVGMGKRMGLST